MIAIPNMEKPKSCYNHCLEGFIANEEVGCPLKDYIESHQYKDRIHPDCPLIEIVTCGECKHRDPEDKKCDSGMFERQGCIFPVDDDYFCKYGERRNDESNTERD